MHAFDTVEPLFGDGHASRNSRLAPLGHRLADRLVVAIVLELISKMRCERRFETCPRRLRLVQGNYGHGISAIQFLRFVDFKLSRKSKEIRRYPAAGSNTQITCFEFSQEKYQGEVAMVAGACTKARQAISKLVAFTDPSPEAKLQPGWAPNALLLTP